MEAKHTNAGIDADREAPQHAGVTGSTQEGPPPFRLTLFTSDGPLLSKRITLGADGKPELVLHTYPNRTEVVDLQGQGLGGRETDYCDCPC